MLNQSIKNGLLALAFVIPMGFSASVLAADGDYVLMTKKGGFAEWEHDNKRNVKAFIRLGAGVSKEARGAVVIELQTPSAIENVDFKCRGKEPKVRIEYSTAADSALRYETVANGHELQPADGGRLIHRVGLVLTPNLKADEKVNHTQATISDVRVGSGKLTAKAGIKNGDGDELLKI